MNWISSFELLVIHEKVIAETGGNKGVLDFGNLKAAVSRPFAAFGDKELFPDLMSKVAAQIHAISSYHPFVDGNKCTALVAADVCLRLNDYRLANSEDDNHFSGASHVVKRRLRILNRGSKSGKRLLIPIGYSDVTNI